MNGFDRHRERVQRIASKVEEAFEEGEELAVSHSSNHSVRTRTSSDKVVVDVDDLDHFVEVDEDSKTALVEPDISMRQLVDKTLQHGLLPHVVPEFPEITMGGAVEGGGGESSSFKYGLVGKNCNMFELVTGKGEIVEASPENRSDLFQETICSYGSTGILTEIHMDLIEAKEFVKLKYVKVASFKEMLELIDERMEENEGLDFMDGIMFSKDRGVLMLGAFSDGDQDLPVSKFSKPWNEWFYIHAENASEKPGVYQELIPVKEYLFRYNYGSFWASKYGFKDYGVPFNRLTRTLLHPLMDTSTAYDLSIHGRDTENKMILQDIVTARSDVQELFDWCDEKLGVYPIWVLPAQTNDKAELAPNYLDADYTVNLGIWGVPESGNVKELKKGLEGKVLQLEARKTLYAQQFFTEQQFWSQYNREKYREVRKSYKAEGMFPSVYEATHVDQVKDIEVSKSLLKDLKKQLPF
ncbi:MAG: FAD-binding protein [Candidatus Nanohalobium sp.]